MQFDLKLVSRVVEKLGALPVRQDQQNSATLRAVPVPRPIFSAVSGLKVLARPAEHLTFDGCVQSEFTLHIAAYPAVKKKAASQEGGGLYKRREPKGCLRGLDVANGDLAAAAISFGVEGDLLALDEAAHSSTLQGGRVNEHVLAAVIRGDEAEALGLVVKLNSADSHGEFFQSKRTSAQDTPIACLGSAVEFLEEKSERALGNA